MDTAGGDVRPGTARSPSAGIPARVHLVARCTIAAVFAYHGLVPKILRHDPVELAIVRAGGVPSAWAHEAVTAIGWGELLFGVVLLVAWQSRWPLWLALAAMAGATFSVAVGTPVHLVTAFNALTLNLCVAALAAIDIWIVAAHHPQPSRDKA